MTDPNATERRDQTELTGEMTEPQSATETSSHNGDAQGAASSEKSAETEASSTKTKAPSSEAGATGNADAATAAPEGSADSEKKTPTAEEELIRVRDQLLRTAADFDNFRKRSRKELADADKQGRGDLLRELLPVFDNLERAAAHASSATDVQTFAEGISLVMRQFIDTLARIGIERIAAQGVPFDPTVHEAIQHLPTTEHTPGTVAAELQAGYRMGDRLIRPSLVVVAKAPEN